LITSKLTQNIMYTFRVASNWQMKTVGCDRRYYGVILKLSLPNGRLNKA